MNACMLIPHIFSPSNRRKICERESHTAEVFPALPRLWLPITPYEYASVRMETHVHMNICMSMYAHKKKIIHEETLAFCFPTAGSPMLELRCWGTGSSQGRGKAAGLVLQCDHDSTCWTPQGKGSRGDKLVLLGTEGAEDRQEALVQSKNCPAAAAETELALQVSRTPTRRTILPAPSWRDFSSLDVPIHPAWNMAMPKPSWGRNTWWTQPTGYQPTGSKMQISQSKLHKHSVSAFLSSAWR